jgi:predicted SAM-dependent methyltransferase
MKWSLIRIARLALAPAIRGLIFSGECRAQIKFELRLAKNHLLSRRTIIQERCLKVNIACGSRPLEGWVNIDAFPVSPSVIAWDCRRSIPLSDGSAAFIFAEHFFEHIERPNQTDRFLSECLRVLEPGGIIRLVVPDAGLYLHKYCEPGWDGLAEIYFDYWPPLPRHAVHGTPLGTKMEFINRVFRQFVYHRYAYDAETLIHTLSTAGFEQVAQQQFGVSKADTCPDTEEHRSESLYVEGVKRSECRKIPRAALSMG